MMYDDKLIDYYRTIVDYLMKSCKWASWMMRWVVEPMGWLKQIVG